MKSSPGAISGRVTIDGQPASGDVINLQRREIFHLNDWQGSPQVLKGMTDKAGRYKVPNLPPGDYYVFPMMPGFVATNLNQFHQSRIVTVRSGQTSKNIDFTMTRGGAITGRVVNAAGQPMIETYIVYHRYNSYVDRWEQSEASLTDDRGVYRLFGLPAGKYRIVASDDKYHLTFSPGTTDETKATVIDVEHGSEVRNVDIRYGRAKDSYSAEGRLVDGQTGAPLSNVSIATVWSADGRFTQVGAPWKVVATDASGRFRFKNLLQGHHFVSMIASPESGDYSADTFSFEIASDDISGVEIKAYRGATIRGAIVIEGTQDPSVLARRSQLKLIGWQAAPLGKIGSSQPYLQIAEDGTFRLSGIQPGRVHLQEDVWPNGFLLLRVEHQGKEVTDGFQVGPTEEIKDVRVLVAYGMGSIRGQIETNGHPLWNAQGMLLVSRVENSRKVLVNPTNAVDSEGRFVITGLPTGDYNVSFLMNGVGLYRDTVSAGQVVSVRGDTETPVKLILDTSAKKFTDERITLGGDKGTGVIRGQIEVNGDSVPDGIRWIVTCENVEKEGTRLALSFDVDSAGRFQIEGLPPGNYKITARLRPWWLDGIDRYQGHDSAEQIIAVKDQTETPVKLIVNLVNKR